MNDYYYQQSQREKAWMAAQIKELQAKQAVCEHSYRRRTTGGKRSGRQTYREPHMHCHKCQHEQPIGEQGASK